MSLQPFGQTRDGRPVRLARLSWSGGLEVEVLEFGALVHALRFPTAEGGRRNAVLNLPTVADYEAGNRSLNRCLGRVANRIAGGRFPLDGRIVQVSVNEPPNTLHGGKVGFGQRLWRFDEGACDDRRAELTYVSPDGEEGFPGELSVRTAFTLVSADTLEIAYTATPDAPTPVNLSHHLYFNLMDDGRSSVLDHRLQIAAAATTPIDAAEIPTGAIAPVRGGPLDFRRPRGLREALAEVDPQMALAGGLDFNWVLEAGATPALRLTAPDGATLELETDQVGVQIYDGHKLTAPFVACAGLAIEPQGFPDAIDQPNFPSQIVRPGQTYRRTSRYRLTGG